MTKGERGFAGMDPEKRKGLAKKSGEHGHGGAVKQQQTSKRGFAAMDPEKRREIAKKGGQHSHGGGRNK